MPCNIPCEVLRHCGRLSDLCKVFNRFFASFLPRESGDESFDLFLRGADALDAQADRCEKQGQRR